MEDGLAKATGKLATANDAEAVISREIVTQDETLQHLGEQIAQNETSLEAMDEAGLRRREKALRAVQDSLRQVIDLVNNAALAESNERKATERKNRAQLSLTASRTKQSEIETEIVSLEAEQNGVAKAERTVSESADTLRSHLVDGEPCSVCGSSEHPYTHGGIAAFKRAAKGIRKQREALEKRIASANAELKKVASVLGGAKATLESSMKSVSEARNIYRHCTQQYQHLVPTLSSQLIKVRINARIPTALKQNLLPALQTVDDAATTQRRQLELALKELARRNTALANLRKKKEALATIIRQAQLHERQLQKERELAKKEVHSIEINTNQRRTELTQIDAFLLPYLRAVQLNAGVLDSAMAKARKQIESQAQAVIKGRSDERSLLARLEQFRELVATRTAEQEAAQTQHEKHRVGYAKRIEECNALKRERQLLLGGEATSVHRARFEFALRTAKTTKNAAQDSATKAAKRLIEQRQIRDSMKAKLSSLQERIAESDLSFISGYESASLSREEARALLGVSAAECKLLDTHIQSLDKQRQEAAKAEQLRHEDLLRLGSTADNVSNEPKEDDPLQFQLDELRRSCRQSMEEIGSVRQKLATDDEGRAAAGTLREELLALEASLCAWEEVEEAIGSRLGDRFRIFAQSITLEHLVQLANRNLKGIGPRYQLAKGGENNLALHVVDCEMEEEHRSTRSLSGGERFLVSLALALALSALNGRQSFVDTLFIDEGFSGLDPASLDTAIGALEVIQSSGRKVGVITHIDGIKERLAVQVVVEKLGAGRSRVRLHPAIQG
jgi:exonuclease SbcC